MKLLVEVRKHEKSTPVRFIHCSARRKESNVLSHTHLGDHSCWTHKMVPGVHFSRKKKSEPKLTTEESSTFSDVMEPVPGQARFIGRSSFPAQCPSFVGTAPKRGLRQKVQVPPALWVGWSSILPAGHAPCLTLRN